MPIKTEIHGGAHLENKLTHNYPFLLFADHFTVFTLKLFTMEAIIKKMPSKKGKEKRKTGEKSPVARRFKELP